MVREILYRSIISIDYFFYLGKQIKPILRSKYTQLV